mgnify:CR=1 FL=1
MEWLAQVTDSSMRDVTAILYEIKSLENQMLAFVDNSYIERFEMFES